MSNEGQDGKEGRDNVRGSRPRRTARSTVKIPVEVSTSQGKRKVETDEDEVVTDAKPLTVKKRGPTSKSSKDRTKDIEFILKDPESPLVNMDIFDIINAHTWAIISPEAQTRLSKLLPRTAFGFQPTTVDKYHPSQRQARNDANCADESMQVDETQLALDPSVFSDPHLESAAKTFQDHLYSGWFTHEHNKLLKKHEEGIRNGSLHAPWKDELWDENHAELNPEDIEDEANDDDQDPTANVGKRKVKAKTSRDEKLDCFSPLVKNDILRVGDVITYKRRIVQIGVTIEKDALIHDIHPKTHVLTIYSTTGPTRDLPAPLLLPPFMSISALSPLETHRTLREAHVSTASQLESALLQLDGRIPRDSRGRKSQATAPLWKCCTLWRWPAAGWPPEDVHPEQLLHAVSAGVYMRGGRNSHGTLFYLRGTELTE